MEKNGMAERVARRPDLEIIYRDPASLKPNGNNARHHPRRQLRKLRKLIEALGWTSPIIVDETSVVLCGNLRLATAIQMKLKKVPTVTIADLDEADRRALILADNRISQEGTWVRKKLKAELEALADLGFDLDMTGFDTIEIESTLSLDDDNPANDDADDVVDLPGDEKPVSRVGDLWHIGSHRLLCADARDPIAYERLLDGEKAGLIFTDPPFAIPIENNVSGHGRVRHSNFVMGCGETSDEEFSETILVPALKCLAANAAPGAIAFVCCDWRHIPLFVDSGAQAFHELKTMIVWGKTNASNSGFYRPQHEIIHAWQVSKGPLRNNFQMGRKGSALGTKGRNRSNLWIYAGANVFRKGRLEDLADHATVKPKKLVADAIRDCSGIGDIILDCFLGSGTTIVAAAMAGRRGYGIELDSKFCDVAIRRISEACGQPALLDGETLFDEVAAMRGIAFKR